MADDLANYLPPGWTEDMYENPLEHEAAWDAITDEQFCLLQARRAAPALNSTNPPAIDPPAPCVEAIEEAGLSKWGYIIFRTSYSDPASWATFRSRFNALIEGQLTSSAGSGIEEVRSSFLLKWVEKQDRLDGADASVVREYYHELLESSTFPDSMDMPTVLMIDAAAIDSVLKHEAKEFPDTPLQVKRHGSPWVWAVDTDFDAVGNSGMYPEEYSGTLKVAVGSLINELFPIVATRRMGQDELLPADRDDGIWFSAYNPY